MLRTLLLEAGAEKLDLWIGLNDRIADGRDVSWVWDADFELLAGAVRRVICAGTRAPEMALRLKYAGWPAEAIAVEAGIERSLDRALRRVRIAPLRPSHLHRAAGAAQAARRSRPRRGVLAVSGLIWHEVECGAYTADLPLWEELAGRSEEAIMELGCGAGRVTLHLAQREPLLVLGVDWDAELVAAAWERSANLRGDAELADVRSFEFETEFSLVIAPMQLIQLLRGPEDRVACLASVQASLLPGGLAAFAIVEEIPVPPPDSTMPPLPDVREVDGWIYSSLPLEPEVGDETILLRRLRQTIDPDGNLTDELNEIELRVLSAETLEEEGRSRRPAAGRAPRDPRNRCARRLGRRPLREGRLMELRLLALYPEQMNIYADRGNILFLQRRCEWRGIEFAYAAAGPGERFDPAAHDFIYLGGGQDRDQRAVAADMVESKRDALAAAAGDGAVVLAVCGGYQLLGHSYQLGEETPAGSRPGRPGDRSPRRARA